MKSGANFSDLLEIKSMYANGDSIEKISTFLMIDAKCVRSFCEPLVEVAEDEDEDDDDDIDEE